MKKSKVMMLLLTVCLVLGSAGCGKVKEASRAQTEETAKEEESRKVPKGQEEKQEKTKKDTPVLGEECSGYDGFQYLYEETLMGGAEEDEESGKKKSEKLTIFLPDDEYNYVSRDMANAQMLGVDFEITMNPYFQYDEEHYLLSENLDYFLDQEYDEYYRSECKDLRRSEVEKIGEDSVRATVNYCEYDDWDEEYKAVFCTYYVKELPSGTKVLVEVEIRPEEVTGKTEALLEELEAFYQFDIDWNEEAAKNRVKEFLSSDSARENKVSTGYMVFELPEGWAQDKDNDDYDTYSYAPDGDAEFSGCVISIKREYMGNEDFDVRYLLEDEEYTREYFESLLGDNVSDVAISDYGDTCLGRAVEVSLSVNSGVGAGKYWIFMMTEDYYIYMIEAMETEDASEDVYSVVTEILETAQTRK